MAYIKCDWCGNEFPSGESVTAGKFLKTRFYCSNRCKKSGEENKSEQFETKKQTQVEKNKLKQQESIENKKIELEEQKLRMEEQKLRVEQADNLRKQGRAKQAFLVEHWKTLGSIGSVIILLVFAAFVLSDSPKSDSAKQPEKNEQVVDDKQPATETQIVAAETQPAADPVVEPPAVESISPVADNITSNSLTVISDKAYFYSDANIDTKRKGYLVNGQSVITSKTDGNFVYAEYTNDQGTKTTGWLLRSDLQ